MNACIALFRAINVGTKNQISMPELCSAMKAAGHLDVRSHLRSGNVVFRSDVSTDKLEAALEELVKQRFGLDITVIVRTSDQWTAAINANPFTDEARDDPARLLVGALKTAPTPDVVDRLRTYKEGPERIEADGHTLYLHYAEGIGRSKLTTKRIEIALGTQVTARNWNTVLKLAQMVES